MLFWLLALAVTAIACAALYYAAAGRRVNAARAAGDDMRLGHFRQQLVEIDADVAQGRLGEAEAQAARAEIAREVVRLKADDRATPAGGPRRLVTAGAIVATALVAFGTYAALGHPELPAQPLGERLAAAGDMTLEQALARIEAQLKKTPEDVRGWQVIAPVYMQLGRFADAEAALRKVIALDGATADRETDLGEAIMMKNGGVADGEPLALFRSAAQRDPAHVRSRYYIAGELTRSGDYADAVPAWQQLLALSSGGEQWVQAAQEGLSTAENGLKGIVPPVSADVPDSTAVAAMVDGLADRLKSKGGSIGEWTRLVRSRLVQGRTEDAQSAYDAARAAYPDASVRTELDVLAADNGLVARQ